jgi:NADPH-dependent glutamate synthase beta subunit-like oxidoreductase
MRFLLKKPEEVKDLHSGKRIAIIGAGPAGLTLAGRLRAIGHDVTIYEKLPYPGGLLMFGIPERRIPKEPIKKSIEDLRKAGVEFVLNKEVSDDDLEKIIEEFDAVFIATGARKAKRLSIPGSDAEGVFHAMDRLPKLGPLREGYISEDEVPKIGKKVLVVGAGFTAMDAIGEAIRRGAEVYVSYRRTAEYAPSSKKEIEEREKKGAKFLRLTQPKEYVKDENGHVKAVKLMKMRLGEPDESGRPRPEPTNEIIELEVDTVVECTGERATPPFSNPERFGIKVTKRNTIITDELMRTSREKVFAGGDVVAGPSNIGTAVSHALKALRGIEEYFKTGKRPSV